MRINIYNLILLEDTILFFHGEAFVDDYDSQLSMRADKVFTLNAARDKYSKYLNIVLSSDSISKDKISSLKDIILKNEQVKLRLYFHTKIEM